METVSYHHEKLKMQEHGMRFAGHLYRHDELTSNLRVLWELDPSVRVRASDWDKLYQRGCETYDR